MKWQRILRLTGVGIIGSLLTLTVMLAWLGAGGILYVGCQGGMSSLDPEQFDVEAISFMAKSDLSLDGWFTTGDKYPEIVIVAVPGHAGNTWAANANARIFAEAGYSTLVYEHRTCADPSLAASTGYHEAEDLRAAVAYLQSRDDIEHIGGIGFSEGATAMILATSDTPELEAIIAMGGYLSMEDDILHPNNNIGLYERLFRRLFLWSMYIRADIPPHKSSPIDVIAEISPRPIFLIYGEYEAAGTDHLLRAAGESASLWIVPGVGHGGYENSDPVDYQKRILIFMADSFDLTIE